MLQRLDDRHVRVLQRGVLSNQNNRDRVEQPFLTQSKGLPSVHQVIADLLHLTGHGELVQVESFPKVVEKTLVFEEQRNVVGRRDVVYTHYLSRADMTEHGDLFHCSGEKRVFTSTGKLILASH